MLSEICKEINNWFDYAYYRGSIAITNGMLDDDYGLQDGQYYRIVGSVFNDGVHKHEPHKVYAQGETPELKDESFSGAIWLMAVPQEVIKLDEDVTAWVAKYGSADSPALSPFDSESFGGYSYSKGSMVSERSKGSGKAGSWEGVFASRLNRWRKIRP